MHSNQIKKITLTSTILLFILLNFNFLTAQNPAGEGAFLGALAGAVFGDGDALGDVVGGALIGGGIGAIAGGLDGNTKNQKEKEEFDRLVKAFGEDNLRGYVELLKCNHDKAIALSKVGQIANNKDHQLAGLWLEAIAEKDRRGAEKTKALAAQIVEQDPDIDDLNMARTAIDQYVLDLRADRRSNQLSCN